MTVIDQIGDYKILKSHDYIVKNVKGSHKHHGHFKQLKTCYTVIRLLHRGQVPKSSYLRGSALRLSLDDGYKAKEQRKIDKDSNRQLYININKGVK